MNVLLTGSSGFLGKEIIKQLTAFRVYKLNRNTGEFICDLSSSIPSFENSFDLVIHNAGKAHIVPKTKEQKLDFFKINVSGTENLLKGLEKNIPKQFIFISSVAVYGLDIGTEINENSPLLAKDPYGLSKVQAEQIVLDWCKKNNVICTILRLPLLVGENPPGNLGAMIIGIKKGYYFNIAGGLAKKSMVLAEDVSIIIPTVSEIGGIYNLTDGYHPNFKEFSGAIAKKYGKSKVFNLPLILAKCIALFGDIVGAKFPLNSKKIQKITSDLTFDDNKAKEVLGWNPKKVIDFY
jgi:nucleoside-diphosphate-sugar epimerase